MAEILLFHKTKDCIQRDVTAHHYLEEYPESVRNTWDAKMLRKYEARNRVGDIIQIEEDGFWTDGTRAGWGYPIFYLLCLTFVTKSQVVRFLGPWMDANGLLARKCKYGVVDMLSLPFVNGKLVITKKQDALQLIKDASTGSWVTL